MPGRDMPSPAADVHWKPSNAGLANGSAADHVRRAHNSPLHPRNKEDVEREYGRRSVPGRTKEAAPPSETAASRGARSPCLMDLPAAHGHARVEFDLAECALVARYVLLQDCEQRFSLLRAQVNPLEISDLNLSFALLLQCAEDQEEIPDVHAYLHAVGIVFPVVRSVHQFNAGLSWSRHTSISVAVATSRREELRLRMPHLRERSRRRVVRIGQYANKPRLGQQLIRWHWNETPNQRRGP